MLNLRTSALNTFGFDDERDEANTSSRSNQTWFDTWVGLKPMSLKKLLFKNVTALTTSTILSRVFIRNDYSRCMTAFKKSSVTGLGEICSTIHPFVYKIPFRKISPQRRLEKRKLNKNLRNIFVKLNSVLS